MRRFRISSKTHPSARVAAQLVARNPTKSPQRLPAPRSAAKLVSEEITTTPVFSPVPPRPTQDHECFIEFYETIELKPDRNGHIYSSILWETLRLPQRLVLFGTKLVRIRKRTQILLQIWQYYQITSLYPDILFLILSMFGMVK